ncbi:hypothetical protein A9Q91_01410 [Candidatus Gracilibacteria bacterium 28_42_T64]|nr:hypothetical protein A9Q91_01410 [Candidatus Gracilibacteria bacterium 28_42_T64]
MIESLSENNPKLFAREGVDSNHSMCGEAIVESLMSEIDTKGLKVMKLLDMDKLLNTELHQLRALIDSPFKYCIIEGKQSTQFDKKYSVYNLSSMEIVEGPEYQGYIGDYIIAFDILAWNN